jgi:ABC-type dipeptide/oligopeptide/nickel transport system permease subunit
MLGAAILLFEIIVAVNASLLAPHDPYALSAQTLRLPGEPGHPLGTDELGRDVLSRLIHGTGISLLIGVLVVAISLAVAIPIGLAAAMIRRADMIVMRVVDALLAFPGMLLALALAAALGPSLISVMLAVGVSSAAPAAVTIRATSLSVLGQEYITAARAIGMPETRIGVRHVLPNIMAPIIVGSTFRMATAILVSSALSFLGLGAQPPSPEWGLMLASGRSLIYLAPHVAAFPGAAIFLTVLAYNLLGDGMRDALDPRLRA